MKKLKKLKKRVKSLEENQCYIEQKLDKLTEWFHDNIKVHYVEDEDDLEQSEPEPLLKFDDLDLGFIATNEWVEEDEVEQWQNKNKDFLTNDEADAEEYSYKIEGLEAKLRAGGITHRISYESYLQQLVNEMRDEKAIGKFGDRTNPHIINKTP